jgi:protein-S-isoprenylcysteine O-methyltransferase Ste14
MPEALGGQRGDDDLSDEGYLVLVTLFNVVAVAWPISEVILGLLSRGKRRSAAVRDRGSLVVLWIAIVAGVTLGNLIRFRGVGSISASPAVFVSAALVLLVCGLALRWTAILTLGHLFTPKVAVRPGQRIVRTGVYRHVRHPAYSGLLLAFLGLGLAFDNWLSLAVLLIPILLAVMYRMRVEENALVEILGREYADYCEMTRRLIPGVY